MQWYDSTSGCDSVFKKPIRQSKIGTYDMNKLIVGDYDLTL